MSTTLTLPDELAETYAEIARRRGTTPTELMRDALEEFAEQSLAEANGVKAPAPSWGGSTETNPEEVAPADGGRRFASLGAGESTVDDGYDSTNIKDWIRKTWRPDKTWSTE